MDTCIEVIKMTTVVNYTNPVLPGFYPDPSVIRVEDDYYLVTSTFEYYPGVPIFHSKNLIDWKQIGHVLHSDNQVNLLSRNSSEGIYAPVLRYHDGVFYMITTDVYGISNFYVTATNPSGPWSEPITIKYGGIDPSLFFDDDGKVYVSVQSGFGKTSHIIQYEIDVKTGEALTEPVVVFEGDEGPWVEGPHLYKINGMYYMMTASGGTGPEHREIIGRSKSPYGPFELYEQPILTHKDLKSSPIQYTGHVELVDDQFGNWWTMFLAVRPQNSAGSVLGRETFLAPVTWVDGWPLIDNNEGKVQLSMSVELPQDKWHTVEQTTERVKDYTSFNSYTPLSLQWLYNRVLPTSEQVSLAAHEGKLTLVGNKRYIKDGKDYVFVAKRQQHQRMRVETKLKFKPQSIGEYAGIAARLSDSKYIAIGIKNHDCHINVTATQVQNNVSSENHIYEDLTVTDYEIYLAIESDEKYYYLKYATNEQQWHTLLQLRTEALTPDGLTFTGVCIGMFSGGIAETNSTEAQFAYYNYEQLD